MFDGKKVALHFSGGKDSLACLYFLRPHWDEIDVIWLNTGAAFPETIAQMARIRELVPRFIEVRSDQPLNIEQHGIPSDIVPIAHTPLHNVVTRESKPLIQSFLDCCCRNVWEPMRDASRDYDVIIRGQKLSDHKKAAINSGHVENGIQYYFPIEHWTDAEVYAYLEENEIELPPTYKYFGSSADCWSCTAYLSENVGKRDYLMEFHPEKHRVVEQRISFIRNAVSREMEGMK